MTAASKQQGGQLTPWKGVRVVDGNGLENRRARKGTVGSNPTPSASYKILLRPSATGEYSSVVPAVCDIGIFLVAEAVGKYCLAAIHHAF